MVKSYSIYYEYWSLIKLLSPREQEHLSYAINKYMFDDELIKLNEKEKSVFANLIRPLKKSKIKSKNATNQNENKNETNSKQNKNEIETKLNQNENKSNTHQDVNVNDNVYVDVNNIFNYLETNFSRTLSPIEYEIVNTWEDNELTRYAIKESVLNGAYSIKYIETILNGYKNKNITTVQQAKEDSKKFKEEKSKSKNSLERFDEQLEAL